MKNYSAKEIKNIVLIGAPGTGKTTLAEAMAFEGKVIDRRGSIEANNTLSDNTDIEHEYKRSIYSTILFTEFMDRKLNIIDCPGSDDFCGSLFSAFKVGDVGVFLFNAQNGWEVGSEIQARYARLLQKPVIGVVNQLDAEKASFEATVESIRASSRVKPVIVQYPVNQGPEFNAFIDVLLMKMYRFKDNDGHREELEIPAEELEKAQELNKELVEMAAEHDEALMELYFDKGTLTQDDIRSGLKIGVSKREVMPIFCTSGKRDIGTKRLMEFIINVAPGPQKAPAFLSTEGEEITADETAPAVAFVFKSQVEQHIGEITYFRVIRGRIAEGAELVNTRTGNKEKLSQLFAVAGKNRIKVTELMAGDIGCTVKLKGTRTNDTLSAPSAPVTIEPIVFPEPRYRAAIKCKDQADEEKLGKVLNDAKFEDPTILVEYSKELKQTIIQGQGEHHLNILRSRIEKENKLAYEYIAPKIPYRETITKVAQADYRHKKQSGGAGQFGEVHMIIEPYYEGIGEPKKTFPEIGESYRESRRAVEVGRIFLTEQHIYVYRSLVLERFLMDIPREMGTRYHGILFNRKTARLFNDEMLHTIEMFFAKDLNLSDTARQLYIHRNTLVYRLDKVQRQTGLDLRKFDDAVTFKMMMLLGKSGKDKPRPVY